MALHISPSGITCFPKVATTLLTPSQYQKFRKMSTANRQDIYNFGTFNKITHF